MHSPVPLKLKEHFYKMVYLNLLCYMQLSAGLEKKRRRNDMQVAEMCKLRWINELQSAGKNGFFFF